MEIWTEEITIKKENISLNADFFEIGGNSLKAANVASRIQDQLGITMPLVELFRNPTIKQLAEYICSVKQTKSDKKQTGLNEIQLLTINIKDKNLVLLRKGTDNENNLFMIHAGSGEVEGYIKFCQHLNPEINCWGLRADRLQQYTPRNITIETTARQYVNAIKKIQSHGPYHIAGWCIGGTIAFEMITQLEYLKQITGFFALINSNAPEPTLSKTTGFTLKSELTWLKNSITLPDAHIQQDIKQRLENINHLQQLWPIFVEYLEEIHFDLELLRKAMPANIADATPNFNQQNIRGVIFYLNMLRTFDNARNLYIPEKKINKKIKTQAHFFCILYFSS